jgi:hypothetical protein
MQTLRRLARNEGHATMTTPLMWFKAQGKVQPESSTV